MCPICYRFFIEIWYLFQWPYTRFKTSVKFEVFAKDCLDEVWWSYSPFMELFIIESFYSGTMETNNFCKHVNVFQTTFFVAVWKCWMFYVWFFPFYINFFCILLSWLITACGTVVKSDRWTILEIAKDLKTKTFLSAVTFLIRHGLRTLSIFTIWLWKFSSCSSFLL